MLITAAGRAALLMYLQLEEREGLTSAGVNGSALIGFTADYVTSHPRLRRVFMRAKLPLIPEAPPRTHTHTHMH